ncbi:TRAP transporter substrate-binding protein [Paenibacillus hamazuiensis]|uniref:TRAP transporter substrate-binding protein n=1 Tax=Paenibacillus hamazuiensis TaxID=2936508 RepID=UPI00200FBE04|nr:TRAP transporter substrate-binding protein [Paenibacillus hamazuiensis]
MKSFIGTGLFVVIGLAAALMIGFYPAFTRTPAVFDDEQSGMSREIVIKFSHVVAENTPKGLAASEFARLVQEKTNGRVKVEVYPNGVLYTEPNEQEALLRGSVQMIAPSFSNISGMSPPWIVMDLPYAFLSNEAVKEAFAGDIGAALFDKLKSRGIIGMAFWGNGFKQMTSNVGPMVHPADFKGQRFRILPSRAIEEYFRLMDARTFPIPFNDTYRNLEQGTVDGEENSISNIYSKKFYQVQKYMTLSNHGYLGYAVLMNKTFWDKLPEELHAPILEAMKEATVFANETAIAINEKQLAEIRSMSGIRIHEQTPEERREWMEAMDPAYNRLEPIVGAELIGKIRELQRKYGK